MKKRLRKKFHVGEFQEFGFSVTCAFKEGFSFDDLDVFINRFVDELLEANKLEFDGSGDNKEWFGFITLDHRGALTEKEQTKVSEWFAACEEVASCTVGDLIDAWN